MRTNSEHTPEYHITPVPNYMDMLDEEEDEILVRAQRILCARLHSSDDVFSSPDTVKLHLKLHLAEEKREVFGALWLTAQHRLILREDMFLGTLTQCSVYPREVLKLALQHNAGACILYHNHPSGMPEPSQADIQLTRDLKNALNLIDVRVLDHIIVGGVADPVSLASRGLV
jgi:DNA repair protein RadC